MGDNMSGVNWNKQITSLLIGPADSFHGWYQITNASLESTKPVNIPLSAFFPETPKWGADETAQCLIKCA